MAVSKPLGTEGNIKSWSKQQTAEVELKRQDGSVKTKSCQIHRRLESATFITLNMAQPAPAWLELADQDFAE